LIAILALAGGTGVGAIVTLSMHRPAAAAAEVVISPSANVIGAPLTRQPTPALTGLTDQNGKEISLGDEKGHVVLVAFMDPLCVDLCPVLGRDIAAVEQTLPKGISPVPADGQRHLRPDPRGRAPLRAHQPFDAVGAGLALAHRSE